MSELRIGDLAFIVDGHCNRVSVGKIITVLGFLPQPHTASCCACGLEATAFDPVVVDFHGTKLVTPRSWLRKIEPLPESETQQNEEELTI